MKKLFIFIIFGILLLSSCSEKSVQSNMDSEPIDTSMQYVIGEQDSNNQDKVKFFEVRITENDIDPSEINVNTGDNVRLSVASLVQLERNDLGDKEMDRFSADENDFDRHLLEPIRFEVEGFPVDQAVYEGSPTIIAFTADKSGEFVFGDMSHQTRKGLLVVS